MNRTACTTALLAHLLLANALVAQEEGFPYLNALGRMAGIGYTKGGYHAAANGQLPIVKRHQPPSHSYRSWRLMYPYHPGYQPFRDSSQRPGSLGQPAVSGFAPTPAPKPPEEVEQDATTDVPPPEWLEDFLDEDKSAGGVGGVPEVERSGSQVPGGQLPPKTDDSSTPNSNSSIRFDRQLDVSPSDRQGSEAPEADDSLLLLESDDLSLRTETVQPPAATVRAVVNRYRIPPSPRMMR